MPARVRQLDGTPARNRHNGTTVTFDKRLHFIVIREKKNVISLLWLYLTPPSSPSSGLSSDVDGATERHKAVKTQPALAIFVRFSAGANRHEKNRANNLALPAVEPVLAGVALDHKLGHVVG